jgi:hypothetical protein
MPKFRTFVIPIEPPDAVIVTGSKKGSRICLVVVPTIQQGLIYPHISERALLRIDLATTPERVQARHERVERRVRPGAEKTVCVSRTAQHALTTPIGEAIITESDSLSQAASGQPVLPEDFYPVSLGEGHFAFAVFDPKMPIFALKRNPKMAPAHLIPLEDSKGSCLTLP